MPGPSHADALAAPFTHLGAEAATVLLREHYGITIVGLRRLTTERDDTFLVTGRERSVLKIAHPSDDPAVVDLQTAAMTYAAGRDPGLPLARVLPTTDGHHQPVVGSPDGPRIMRLLSYLPGDLVDYATTDSRQRRALGATLARLTLALNGFSHPAAHLERSWDLQHLASLRDLLTHCPPDVRDEVERTLDRFDAFVAPRLPAVRHQVVHNDLNPENVLVDPTGGPYVTGVLDFGDMAHTALVVDLAVAMAYAVPLTEVADPWAAPYDLLEGYCGVLPLTSDEYALVPDLVRGRQAQRLLLNSLLALRDGRGDHDRDDVLAMPGVTRQLRSLAAPAPQEER